MKLVSDFREFLERQNVVGLAIGVVVGAAVGKLVSALVDDLVMPLVGLVLPGGDWRSTEFVLSGTSTIRYGDLLGRGLDFLIVGFVVYLFVRYIFALEKKAPPPATKTCPACLESIPMKARRCRACGEVQGEVDANSAVG